jgi:hypothetical protein
VENIPQQDSAERAFNKLTRTFAMQMEALKRYRSGAEQKVTLQHVSVAEGGQAIVGNVTGTTQERAGAGCAGEGCDATASAPRYECPANAKHRQKQGTRPTFNAAQVKQMSGDHKRNTGPMLSTPLRRSGRPCKSPAVHGKRRCRMHGGALGSGAPRGNKNALKHGRYTREAIAERARVRELVRQARKLLL